MEPRIEELAARVYTVPTDAPEADGTLAWDSTTMVMVEVVARTVVGTGWTYGPPACAILITDTLADTVTGRGAFDVAGAFDAMVLATRNASRPGVVGYAISAVDVALWDLKVLELPLFRLLGAVRAEVPVYGSGGFTSYDETQLRDQLTHWAVEQQIPRVKIKIGESWGGDPARDLRRMTQPREVIGPEVELFVDANGGYGRKQAIRVMDAAAELNVRWVEEPVSSDALEWFHDHVRIESMFFDGTLNRTGGVIRPDPDAPRAGTHVPDSRRRAVPGPMRTRRVPLSVAAAPYTARSAA